jgi:acetate kinase
VRVLCLNAGSSSLKGALFDVDAGGARRRAHFDVKVEHEAAGAAAVLERALRGAGIGRPDAVGHRLVHGGPARTRPVVLTPEIRAELDLAVPFAPLHLPSELAVVTEATRAFHGVPQVACFDTAFHATLPEVARRLPVAAWANDAGVRRYGFHGLSCEYVVGAVGADALGSAVIAHLGSGASLTAVHGGVSVDTSMGMSPSGGIMMGTRPGDLDPGVLLHLLAEQKWRPSELEKFVNRDCGLLGVSGTTSDMRELLERRGADVRARLAVDLFVYTAQKAIGGLAVALGGMTSLVFTGGIGAHSAVVRAEIAARLGLLGVAIDPERNAANAGVVSPDGAPCTVRVIETDEEQVIARRTHALLFEAG